MKKTIRTLLAITLAMALVFSSALSVMAEDEYNNQLRIDEDKLVNDLQYYENNQWNDYNFQAQDAEIEKDNEGNLTLNEDLVVTETEDPQTGATGPDAALQITERVNEMKPIEFDVNGDVEMTEEAKWAEAEAIYAQVKYGGDVTIEATGNAEATANGTESANAYAVYAEAGILPMESEPPVSADLIPQSSVTVEVGGKAVASADTTEDENELAVAVYASAIGYENYNKGPNTGDQAANTNDGDDSQTVQDNNPTGQDNNTTGQETAVKTVETTVTIGKGAEGIVFANAENGGKTTIEIKEGGVTASDADKFTNIPGAPKAQNSGNNQLKEGALTEETGAVGARNDGGTIGITVIGGIESENGAGIVSENKNGGQTSITVTGGIDANNADYAVFANAEGENTKGENTKTNLNLAGDISNTNESKSIGVELQVQENAQLTATITGENLIAEVKDTSEATQAGPESVPLGDASVPGGDTTTLNNAEGDGQGQIQVVPPDEEAIGLELINGGGTFDIIAETNITATGAVNSTGVVVKSDREENNYKIDATEEPVTLENPQNGDQVMINGKETDTFTSDDKLYAKTEDDKYQLLTEAYDKGTTNLSIVGDVTGDQVGMELDIADVQEAEILVDGTVSGGEAGIVLSEQTKVDNVELTVWQVVPAADSEKNDAVVVTKSKGNDDKPVYTENEEAEKQIQYIIKVDTDQDKIIETKGTREYKAKNNKTYNVANEGETITLKLNIPDGKEVVAAYWDKAKSDACELLKDTDGNYYLVVPKGGGVWLSVTLQDIKQEDDTTGTDDTNTNQNNTDGTDNNDDTDTNTNDNTNDTDTNTNTDDTDTNTNDNTDDADTNTNTNDNTDNTDKDTDTNTNDNTDDTDTNTNTNDNTDNTDKDTNTNDNTDDTDTNTNTNDNTDKTDTDTNTDDNTDKKTDTDTNTDDNTGNTDQTDTDADTDADDETQNQIGEGVSTVLLKIVDTTGTVTISFYSNGTYVAENKDTSETERGHFKLENEEIVLTNSANHGMPITKDGDGWKLLFTTGTDTTAYEFLIEDKDVQTLIENRS